MSDHDLPIGFRYIDYCVFPKTRQIQHQQTGLSFRFNHGRHLELLGPKQMSDQIVELVARGSRAVLDSWPAGSIAW